MEDRLCEVKVHSVDATPEKCTHVIVKCPYFSGALFVHLEKRHLSHFHHGHVQLVSEKVLWHDLRLQQKREYDADLKWKAENILKIKVEDFSRRKKLWLVQAVLSGRKAWIPEEWVRWHPGAMRGWFPTLLRRQIFEYFAAQYEKDNEPVGVTVVKISRKSVRVRVRIQDVGAISNDVYATVTVPKVALQGEEDQFSVSRETLRKAVGAALGLAEEQDRRGPPLGFPDDRVVVISEGR